jgi:iron complex transport system substrate-binding protein
MGLLVAAALASTALVSCASPAADGGSNGAAAEGFPVTIEHAFGETVINDKPERIATVSWANHEVPLALGVVPVGMSKAAWGDDDGDGVLPWVEDQLEELGAETPVLFDETDDLDFEAIADTNPDVILAAYSGLTQEDYDTLSQIAPVVAYPEVAWGTSYEDMIRMNSEAIGMKDEGEQLITDLQGEVDDALAAYPQLEGKKILFSYIDPTDFSKIGFYTSKDTRPGFLESVGMPAPAIVAEMSADSEEFYLEVSAEEADRFSDVDIWVTYGDPEGQLVAAVQADPLLSQIPAIANGQIAVLEDSTPLAASANPSPLSIGWGVNDYFALLAGALDQNG